MKKLFIAALAVCAAFASCSKENGGSDNEAATLTIKLSGVIQSKAIEDPGVEDEGTITLTNGHIFVINTMGTVTYSEELDVTEATGSGQELVRKVASDSRVYILGNIPAADKDEIIALTTFDAIKDAASAMTTQGDYTKAALANSNGQPVEISLGQDNTASATVSIKPLISRIELMQVKGGDNITAFTVSGVYVDDYYPLFTYGGSYAGTMFEQEQSTTFNGIKDEGTWGATGSPMVAIPVTGKVWAHNVASGGVPRFIIKLTGVEYTGGTNTIDKTYYLTVTGYTGVTAFERGKIYRIGGTDGITFDEEDLGDTPNPLGVKLQLNVTITEWEVVTPAAEL